jgi:hypothetical protein
MTLVTQLKTESFVRMALWPGDPVSPQHAVAMRRGYAP